jgi:hypothetical protein
MNLVDIIKFLRQSVLVQDIDITPNNPEYLTLSDADFKLLLEVALSKVAPTLSIETMNNEFLYPVILLAKKELFHRLALPKAQKFTISVSGGARLAKEQIFEHYMSLIQDVDQEYKSYLAIGIPIKSADLYLSSRYYSERNYNNATKPTIVLMLDTVYSDKVEISWGGLNVGRFSDFLLFLSTSPIVDKYTDGVINGSNLVQTIRDIHVANARVTGLLPNTKYYVAIVIQEKNGLKGFSEITFTTLLA